MFGPIFCSEELRDEKKWLLDLILAGQKRIMKNIIVRNLNFVFNFGAILS